MKLFVNYIVSLEELTIGGRGSDDIWEMLLKQQLLPSTLYTLHIYRLSIPQIIPSAAKFHLMTLEMLYVTCRLEKLSHDQTKQVHTLNVSHHQRFRQKMGLELCSEPMDFSRI
ncbi:hypothetical protein Prudu_005416 [Prunus dulcis]|uniref:Uncharacterized protein n=1 Tax=Prunus dulcis TaxID=3755 RepID=A0A4Y1QXK5_PRUDU|nr:hypothetical protein Prudu_005416 [Prunus dulcis]